MKKIKINTFSAIELDNRSIKIAQSQLILAKPKITRIVFDQFNDLAKDDTLAQVRQLLEREKLQIDSCVLSIPRHSVTTRYLKLPSNQDEEIDKMVRLQVPKLLPYTTGEIIYSYSKIASDAQGYSYSIVVLAHQGLIRLYYSFLQSLGINPSMAILSSQACANWLKLARPSTFKDETVILVDIDALDADIMIINSGELVFTRSVSRPAPDSGQDWLGEEINRSLQTANKEIGSQNISNLILTGSISGINTLGAALSGKFTFPQTTIPSLKEEFASSLAAFGPAAREQELSFTCVVAASLSRANFSIDLLPDDIKLKIRSRRIKKERKDAITLSLLIVFLLFALFALNIFEKRQLVKALDQRIMVLLPKASMREQVNLHFQNIRGALSQPSFMSEILREIYKAVPENVSLSSLSIARDKFLIMKGEASGLSDIFSLVGRLEKCPYLKNVRVRYATKRRAKDVELTDFQVECLLRVNK